MTATIKTIRGSYAYISDIAAIYGREHDILFVVTELERMNMICTSYSITDVETVIPAIEALRNRFDAIPYGGVYREGSMLNVELNLINITDAQQFKQIIEAITEAISKNGSVNCCSKTGVTQDVGIFRVGTKLEIVSEATFEDQTEADNSYAVKQRSPIVAWAAAIGAMLVGVGVWILIGSFGWIAGFAGFLILQGGIRAYERTGGILYKKDAYIMIGLAIAMIFVAEYLSIAVQLFVAGIPLGMAFSMTFEILFSSVAAIRSYLFDVAIGIGLSLWASWGLINHVLNFSPDTKKVRRKNNRLL